MKFKKISILRVLMIKSLLLIFFLLSAGKAQSSVPDPFVTRWHTDGNNKIIIPLLGDGYDFHVEWGDGNADDNQGTFTEISHTYTFPNIYTVTITPNTFSGFPRFYLNNFDNCKLLLEIKQWGGAEWSSMNQAFSGASNLQITATDMPNLSWVTDLSYMFFNANLINSDFSGWNVSGVTTMENMFNNASSFNSTLSTWNVSKVTNMNSMFNSASSFNSDLSGWNVSGVTDMENMFNNATSFNSDLSNWNVSNVTKMNGMFSNASTFNGELSDWNVANVTDLSYMFNDASSFNRNISNWNVFNVTNMNGMFRNASSFNGDLSHWNVANVIDFSYMFNYASSFNGDLSDWNVANVTNMNAMFSEATSFNGDVSGWNVSKVTDMNYMFNNASSFNGNLSNWNGISVTNMSGMFNGAQSFNAILNSWDVSGVTDMSNMFNNARAFNGDLSSWNVANVTNLSYMFGNASSFNRSLSNWNVGNVTNMSDMFNNAISFNGDISGWNVSNVVNINSMFSNAIKFNQDLSTWDISSVTNAYDFLANVKLSPANYEALLLGWSRLSNRESQIPSNLTINFGRSKYSNSSAVIAAKTYLTNAKNWTISDGGLYTPPIINSTVLTINNNTVRVTFSERVYSDINGNTNLDTADFAFAIAGGSATLSSAIPISITTTDNISFLLGIGLIGKSDGSEILTISPLTDAIYNSGGDAASISPSTILLYEALVNKNGKIGAVDSSHVDKNGKTGSSTGLNVNGKALITRGN